jgi:hypothetical protein
MASLRKALEAFRSGAAPDYQAPLPMPTGSGMLAYAETLGFKVIAREVDGRWVAIDPARQKEIDNRYLIEHEDMERMMTAARIEADNFEGRRKPKSAKTRQEKGTKDRLRKSTYQDPSD